jgi:predicted nucleic acid-binding protein
MDSVFVDANVFLRFLARDEDGLASRAKGLFMKARKGQLRLVTGPPVLFEIAWTLKVRYKLPQAGILDILESLITTTWLDMIDKDLAEQAVNMARLSGQDFADAYIHASAQKIGAAGIATFSRKHFDKLGTNLVAL